VAVGVRVAALPATSVGLVGGLDRHWDKLPTECAAGAGLFGRTENGKLAEMTLQGHSVVEHRSRRYHEVIAERLATDNAILERARTRVEEWTRHGTVAPYYAAGWRQVLESPISEISAFLVEDSERARAFRQVSPFAGALSARERWRLWASVKRDNDTTAA
jgi:hypothetical protein